jgi:hypothetical protein
MQDKYELKFVARYIKNLDEYKNIMKKDALRNYTVDDLFVIQKMVGDNFQPIVAFALRDENTNFSFWLKFVAPLELTVDYLKTLPHHEKLIETLQEKVRK